MSKLIVSFLFLMPIFEQFCYSRIIKYKNETEYGLVLHLSGVYCNLQKKHVYRKFINTNYEIGPQKDGEYEINDDKVDFLYFVVMNQSNPMILLDVKNDHTYRIYYDDETVINVADEGMCTIL